MRKHAEAAPLLLLLLVLGLVVPGWNAQAGLPRAVFLELPEEVAEPALALEAWQTRDGTWLLRIDATDFQFTDICQTVDTARPIGHAHVFRGDAKVASAYQPIVDLGTLEPGQHRFDVMLRTQDHRVLAGRNGAITAAIAIEVP